MISFLRRNQQVFILSIFLYSLISVFSVYFIHPKSIIALAPFNLPFLTDYTNYFLGAKQTKFLLAVISFFIIIFSAFYLVRININYMVLSNRSQFAAIFYIVISSMAFRYQLISPAMIAALFLLFAVDRIFGSTQYQGITYRFFDAGMLLALASLFYINTLFFLPFLWVAQITLRSFNIREFLYSLIGLLVPFIYIFSGYFLLDRSVNETFSLIKTWLIMNRAEELSWNFYVGIIMYSAMMLVAQFYALRKFTSTKVQVRKIFQLWFYLFLNSVLIALIIPASGIEMLYFISIPVSVLFAVYFTDCKDNVINKIIFGILIIAPLVFNIIA